MQKRCCLAKSAPRPVGATSKAFTMLEVMLSLMIFSGMSLMFTATLPLAIRSANISTSNNQAAQIVQRKVDQLRSAGYGQLTYAGLLSRGVIDAEPKTGPFSFIGTLPGLLPKGSSATISVVDYRTLNASVPAGQVRHVTVSVQWINLKGAPGSYNVSTLVSKVPYP